MRVARSDHDPNLVLVNPPELVPDPSGEVVIRGERFREDPAAAVASIVESASGAEQKARSRRRGGR